MWRWRCRFWSATCRPTTSFHRRFAAATRTWCTSSLSIWLPECCLRELACFVFCWSAGPGMVERSAGCFALRGGILFLLRHRQRQCSLGRWRDAAAFAGRLSGQRRGVSPFGSPRRDECYCCGCSAGAAGCKSGSAAAACNFWGRFARGQSRTNCTRSCCCLWQYSYRRAAGPLLHCRKRRWRQSGCRCIFQSQARA